MGECRAKPPYPGGAAGEYEGYGMDYRRTFRRWPETFADDECGAWEHQERMSGGCFPPMNTEDKGNKND